MSEPTPQPKPTSRSAERRERELEWRREHQPYELAFHQQDNFRWHDEPFQRQWDLVFGEFCELTPDRFGKNDLLLDLGCGSRPALDWFDAGPRTVHLDPLLAEYRRIPEVARFWQARDPRDLIAAPAEEFVHDLEGRCRFVLCWNVLDHTFDWREILENVSRYVAPGGLACIGTDVAPHGPGHPGIDDANEFARFLVRHFDVGARRGDFLGRELAVVLRKPALPNFKQSI